MAALRVHTVRLARRGSADRGRSFSMLDIVFIAATAAFFALSLAYVRGCDRM
jgi:hypothetical protein